MLLPVELAQTRIAPHDAELLEIVKVLAEIMLSVFRLVPFLDTSIAQQIPFI